MKYCLDRRQMLMGLVMMTGAALSTIFLIISLSSDHLVNCIEKQSKDSAQDDGIYISTNFGLWRACGQVTDENSTADVMDVDIRCESLTWHLSTAHPAAEDDGSEEWITGSILAHPMVKFVFVFLLIGLCVQIFGHLSFMVNRRYKQKNCFMFLTGACYVFSGLSLLAAVVIFMALVTEESLHQKQTADGEIPYFRHWYGTSFIVLTASFCLIEISGILAVYLFIVRYKLAYKKRHVRRHIIKSHSELLQNFLTKRNNHTTAAETRPSNGIASSSDNADGYKSLARDWLAISSKSQPPDYRKVVNSMSADSNLNACNGYRNEGMHSDQNNSNETVHTDRIVAEKVPQPYHSERSRYLIDSNGDILGSVNIHETNNNQHIDEECGDNSSITLYSCQRSSCSEVPLDCEPTVVDNLAIDLELLPPPPVYADLSSTATTCIRKLTTTV